MESKESNTHNIEALEGSKGSKGSRRLKGDGVPDSLAIWATLTNCLHLLIDQERISASLS
jgi:hypothetical protein